MKKQALFLIILALLAITGCKDKFRIYSVAVLERAEENQAEITVIRDYLSERGVQIIDSDSIAKILGDRAVEANKIKLCAAMRSDRIAGSAALGKLLGVDAVVFSAMPPTNKIREKTPCLTDSLISLYLVDPPRALIEARNGPEFLSYLETFDWETIVHPPSPPEEFNLTIGDTIVFAGLRLTIATVGESSNEEKVPENAQIAQKGQSLQGLKSENQQVRRGWTVFFLRENSVIKTETFEGRTVGFIKNTMKYDITASGEISNPTFKAVLTDNRENIF